MFQIPADIYSAYTSFIEQRGVKARQHRYYVKWLRYYLDFCHKYNVKQTAQVSLAAFTGKLKEKKQAENLRKQAHHAISLFYEMGHLSGYTITQKNEGLFQKAVNFITSFRPVLSPSPEGGISVSVQTAFKTDGIKILEETMNSLERFVDDVDLDVHVALDEFQEITKVHNSIGIEGILRQYIQKIQCSFFFIGSRRRILLDIFNDRKKPFFQSALNYELKTLPGNDLIRFAIAQFKSAGKYISKEKALKISQLVSNHPYYMQKFCFFLYEEIDKEVTQKDIVEINQVVMESERIVFESILQGLTTKQITLISALAREPTAKVYSATYMSQYNLGSTGGIQQSLDSLSKKDLIEKNHEKGAWVVVDPVFKNWLIKMSL